MSYSLSEIFKKNVTRDEFVKKFTEMKMSSTGHDASIFGCSSCNLPIGDSVEKTNANDEEAPSAENTTAEETPSSTSTNEFPQNSPDTASSIRTIAEKLFDKIDTNNNQMIDEEEITTAAGYYDDGAGTATEVSENDLNVLYDEILEGGIEIDEPDKMYENALNAEIESLKAEGYSEEEAKQLASYTSTYVLDLDNEIYLLSGSIALAKSDSASLIESYQSETDKAKKEQNDIEKDIAAKQKEITDLENQIKSLDSKDDAEEINAKKSKISQISGDKQELQTKLTQIKSNITNLDTKIKDEKNTAKNKINQYNTRLQALMSARTYAVGQISGNKELGNVISVDSNRFHKNDNLMNFDELAAKGYVYDSETGSALGSYVYRHMVGFTGKCAKKANDANIAVGVLNESDRRGSAYMMADVLAADDNFMEIKVSSEKDLKNLPAGCELVYARGAAGYNSKHGHIEITVGDGTAVSDGMTRNLRYSDGLRVFVPVKKATEQAA